MDFVNWRWKPDECELPRFDSMAFLHLLRGKKLAFIGDSVARNHMESLLCILSQVHSISFYCSFLIYFCFLVKFWKWVLMILILCLLCMHLIVEWKCQSVWIVLLFGFLGAIKSKSIRNGIMMEEFGFVALGNCHYLVNALPPWMNSWAQHFTFLQPFSSLQKNVFSFFLKIISSYCYFEEHNSTNIITQQICR